MIAFVAFSLRRAWQGLWHNRLMSVAATATMVLMLALLSGLIILLTGLDATLKYVEQEVQVVAYLKDSANPQDVTLLETAVGQMPQVTEVSYVSKDQALKDFLGRHPDEAEVVNSLPTNPLPASLQINLRDPNDYLDVAAYLRNQAPVDRVLNIKQTVDQMVTVIGILRAGGIGVLVVVGLIVLFIIVNTIRLAVVSRADEIEIMRLVGASDAFIRWPFIFEGALVGLFGALITIAVLWLCQGPITTVMADYFKVLPVEASATVGRDVALVVLGTGVGIGVLGSYLSIRSYLIR
ncbi:MAG TPA: permease-like cell division protein FtsX [Candidatus Limnocylindrales bacterium]|jgi:Cell division protein|nr:permease-like cell division protein FtsX [Candidatus Limnocylindrales bacterium]